MTSSQCHALACRSTGGGSAEEVNTTDACSAVGHTRWSLCSQVVGGDQNSTGMGRRDDSNRYVHSPFPPEFLQPTARIARVAMCRKCVATSGQLFSFSWAEWDCIRSSRGSVPGTLLETDRTVDIRRFLAEDLLYGKRSTSSRP